MKTGRSLQDLAAELDRQVHSKRDFVAPIAALNFKSNGHSELSMGSDRFEVNDIAHEQVASRLGIPKKYYDTMRSTAPSLLDVNVNHWFSHSKDRAMVRTLDGKARALLSDRFRPLDNFDLAEVAIPELTKLGCRIESCEVTERRMYLKAITERVSFEVKKGDVVQAGIVISNSEVGNGALSIEPLLYRLVCTNGMIMNDSKMRRAHIGRAGAEFDGVQQFFRDETRIADDRALWLKVRDTIAGAFEQIAFDRHVNNFRAAQGDVIEADPIEVVEVTQKRFGFTDRERNGVLQHLLSGGELTRFGLANAVTRTAQDLDSYDRATEFERLGGTIVELPKTDWQSIATAA